MTSRIRMLAAAAMAGLAMGAVGPIRHGTTVEAVGGTGGYDYLASQGGCGAPVYVYRMQHVETGVTVRHKPPGRAFVVSVGAGAAIGKVTRSSLTYGDGPPNGPEEGSSQRVAGGFVGLGGDWPHGGFEVGLGAPALFHDGPQILPVTSAWFGCDEGPQVFVSGFADNPTLASPFVRAGLAFQHHDFRVAGSVGLAPGLGDRAYALEFDYLFTREMSLGVGGHLLDASENTFGPQGAMFGRYTVHFR